MASWSLYPTKAPDFIRKIRQTCTHYPYILMLTATQESDTYTQAIHAGADDLVKKPLNAVEFQHRLKVAERVVSLQNKVVTFGKEATICPTCNSISTSEHPTEPPEFYVARHADTKFSHGICPPCAKEHLGVSLPDSE